MKLGHVPGLTNEEYHASEGISSTGIRKVIEGTPAHYKAYLNKKPESTPAMKLGTAIHEAILEPNIFEGKYVCKPDGMNFTTVEGKAWKSDQKNKEIISFDDFHMIREIQKQFRTDPALRQLFSGGEVEQSYFWECPVTGLLCKTRPDYFDGTRVIDIKTAESASPQAFQRSIAKYNYHIQSQFYLRGLSQITNRHLTDFIHIVIEKQAPYSVACYVLDDASLERAEQDIIEGLAILKTCQELNTYPGYPSGIQSMNLPAYMWSDNESY